MSNGNLTPLQTGFTRVFLIENRAGPTRVPVYMGCMRAGGIDWSLGTISKIECPSPKGYDKFEEKGKSKGEADRPSTSVVGRYAADLESELLRLARIGCSFDLQFHIGICTDPTLFNTFQKAVVWEEADLTSYGADDLGALEQSERNAVNETGEISARELYEILPLDFAEVAGDIITNEIVDVVVCDSVSCGECETQSDGCQRVYAVSLAAGGSPGTPADVVYTLDGAANWNTSEVDSLGIAEDPDALACVSGYVVVVSNDSCSLHYVLQNELDTVGDELWVENILGFVAAGCPNDIWSVGNYAFIVGNNGYIYGLSDPTAGVTVLDAGAATGVMLRAVHAMDRNVAVAVGSNGVVVRTLNGGITWQAMNNPTGVGEDLYCVWVKTETEWWVGSNSGRLLYTLDGGVTWAEKAFNGSGGTSVVYDIAFSSDGVMTIAHATAAAAGVGRLLRSYDGGYDFVVLPEDVGALPAADRFNAIALCENDVNVVAAVGLADNATDGIAIWGED